MKNHTIKKKFVLMSAALLVAVMMSACNSGDVSNVNLEDAPTQNDPLGSDPAMNMPEPGDGMDLEVDNETDANIEVPETDIGNDPASSLDEQDVDAGLEDSAEGAFEAEDSSANEIGASTLPEENIGSEFDGDGALDANTDLEMGME